MGVVPLLVHSHVRELTLPEQTLAGIPITIVRGCHIVFGHHRTCRYEGTRAQW